MEKKLKTNLEIFLSKSHWNEKCFFSSYYHENLEESKILFNETSYQLTKLNIKEFILNIKKINIWVEYISFDKSEHFILKNLLLNSLHDKRCIDFDEKVDFLIDKKHISSYNLLKLFSISPNNYNNAEQYLNKVYPKQECKNNNIDQRSIQFKKDCFENSLFYNFEYFKLLDKFFSKNQSLFHNDLKKTSSTFLRKILEEPVDYKTLIKIKYIIEHMQGDINAKFLFYGFVINNFFNKFIQNLKDENYLQIAYYIIPQIKENIFNDSINYLKDEKNEEKIRDLIILREKILLNQYNSINVFKAQKL